MWSGSINLRFFFFHNPLPLFKTNLHHLFYNAASEFLTGQYWNIFQLLHMKIFYLPPPLPQNFAFCAKSTILVAKLQGILFWHKLYF